MYKFLYNGKKIVWQKNRMFFLSFRPLGKLVGQSLMIHPLGSHENSVLPRMMIAETIAIFLRREHTKDIESKLHYIPSVNI